MWEQIFKLFSRNKYTVGLGILLIAVLGYLYIANSKHIKEVNSLWDRIVQVDNLVKEANGTISQLTGKLNNSKDIENLLTKKIDFVSDSVNTEWAKNTKGLIKIIKAQDETYKSSMTIVGYWKKQADSLKNVTQVEFVPGRHKVMFSKQYPTMLIEGFTLSNPPFGFLEITRDPIIANLTITETKDKKFRSYITLSDPDVIIKKVDTRFIGFKEELSWWGYLKRMPKASVGLYQNEVDISVGLRIWRFEPELRVTSNGMSNGFSFHLLE